MLSPCNNAADKTQPATYAYFAKVAYWQRNCSQKFLLFIGEKA